MNSEHFKRIEKFIRFIIIGVGLVYCFSFILIAVIRMLYPFELEWMEGGTVEHVLRILQGKEIYVRPGIDFMPYIYTPLYYWVSALVAKMTGIGFLPLRIVSIVSSIVCMLFIYMIVRKETGQKFPAMISMTLFPAFFVLSGEWFDLARVDMLFLAFILIAAYILRFHKASGWYVIAGFIAFLSFFTKQTALIVFGMVGLFLLFENLKRSLYFIITFALLTIGSTLFFNHLTDGWYWFWNFSLVAAHRWNYQFLLLFWTIDLLKPLSIAISFTLFLFLLKLFNRQIKENLFYLGFALGMFGCAWSSRLHYGGYENVLIPAHIILAIFMGFGFYESMKFFGKEEDTKSAFIRIFILIIALAQFTTLNYNPRTLIPHPYDLEAGNQFIEHISRVQGEVFIPTTSYISRLAGKKSYLHSMLFFDLKQSHSKYGDTISIELEKALAEGKFSEIYINDWFLKMYPEVDKYYERKGKMFTHISAFLPITGGFITRPDYIYVPRKKPQEKHN